MGKNNGNHDLVCEITEYASWNLSLASVQSLDEIDVSISLRIFYVGNDLSYIVKLALTLHRSLQYALSLRIKMANTF